MALIPGPLHSSSRTHKRSSKRHPPPPPAELLEHACVSLDHAVNVLTEAAASLSYASNDLSRCTVLGKKQRKRKVKHPTISPHFKVEDTSTAVTSPKKKILRTGPKVSPHFAQPSESVEPFSNEVPQEGLSFELQPSYFGLIQERICTSLFALVIQAILWNKTKGTAARPILWSLLCNYPTPENLAEAKVEDLEHHIQTLGLQRRRANRLIDMAKTWTSSPPHPDRKYGRRNYPRKGNNLDVKDGELLAPDDSREGWEIAHLPGVGEYALDSFRIFGRDRLRGVEGVEGVEPEWKRLVPRDKELGPYVGWRWAQEGWQYDVSTGIRTRVGGE